jgi:hypothetical protein
VPEEAEHGRVINRIPDIEHSISLHFDVDAVASRQNATSHGELIVSAEPPQHPQIIVSHIGSGGTHRRRDSGARVSVFRSGEGDTRQPEGLILGESGARNGGKNISRDLGEAAERVNDFETAGFRI